MFKNVFGQKSGVKNPYVAGAEGRAIWNDRYENLSESVRWWRGAFVGAIGVCLALTLAVVKMAVSSRVEPFVVETHQGAPIAIRALNGTMAAQDQRLINFALDQFILNTRTVLSDAKAQATILDNAYAYAADGALQTLSEWFKTHNPYDIAKRQTVSVNIINAMPLSQNTWQLMWDETVKDNGEETAPLTTRWMANVTYRMGEVNPKFMNQNPFGLYVTSVTWSKSQQH